MQGINIDKRKILPFIISHWGRKNDQWRLDYGQVYEIVERVDQIYLISLWAVRRTCASKKDK